MSDWSPPPRPGYTRTGKSLKAVRRYYALKDQSNRRKRSPDKEDRDEVRPNREDRYSASAKRKRSPDDDKLSKRIAAELKVQAEAIEKRSLRQVGMPLAPTDRSELPYIVQPRETGPTFITPVTETNEGPTAPYKSVVKSAKSAKSNRSDGLLLATGELPDMDVYQSGPTSRGCLVTCIVYAFTYVATWLLMLAVKYNSKTKDKKEEKSKHSISWLAISSFLVIIAVPYWFHLRQYLRHAIGSLIFMVLSTANVIVYMIYSIIINAPTPDNTKAKQYVNEDNPLNFWLSISYLVFHLASLSFMIKQLLSLVYGQIKDRSGGRVGDQDQQMSLYLAPG